MSGRYSYYHRGYLAAHSRSKYIYIFRFKLIILAALLVAASIWCSVKAKPLLIDNAEEKADCAVSNAISGGIAAALESDEYCNAQFVSVDYGEDGSVQSVKCDGALLTKFSVRVNDEIEKQINEIGGGEVNVHLGSLLGISNTLGKGPVLRYKYDLSTSVDCDLKSEFSDAGINQTSHRILLNVTVNTTVMIPFCSKRRNVCSTFPIAETVIVGKVPQSYQTINLNDELLFKADSGNGDK